jgi:hypothetical protein
MVRRVKILAPAIALTLTACGAGDVLQAGPSTYQITAQEGLITGGWSAAQREAIAKGEQYCSALGQHFTLIGANNNGMPGWTPLSSSITFSCGADANAARQAIDASNQACQAQMVDHDLDPIRDKVELIRSDTAGPPPFAILSNESLPTQQERISIGKWATIRDACFQRFTQAATSAPLPPNQNPLVREKSLTFNRQGAERLDILIVVLYQGKMTFSEFAKERAQIGEETAAARQDWLQAVQAADQQRAAQQQQLALQQQQLADQRYQTWLQASILQNQQMQSQLQSLKPTMTNCRWLPGGWNCMTN